MFANCEDDAKIREQFITWHSEVNESEHLRHHEVGLLGNQGVLLVDELEPLLDHFGGAVAAWDRKKHTGMSKCHKISRACLLCCVANSVFYILTLSF